MLSVWLGLAALVVAALMAVRREWLTDVGIAVALYSAIFSLTFAGMTLWALRKEPADGPGVAGRRTQCKAGAGLSVAGIIIVYALVHRLAAGK